MKENEQQVEFELKREEALPSEIFWDFSEPVRPPSTCPERHQASSPVPRGLTAPLAKIFDVANLMLACGQRHSRQKDEVTPAHLSPTRSRKETALTEESATNPAIPLLHSLTPVAKKNRSRYGNTTAAIPKIFHLTSLEKGV